MRFVGWHGWLCLAHDSQAFRTHQRQLEQQNVALQHRATARIRELPIIEYK